MHAKKTKWNIPPSFNLIEIDEDEKEGIKMYRVCSRGGKKLVLEMDGDKATKYECFGTF